jgi:folate-dependent phosphoribosylglycinamide formyltransferase PurN
VTVTPNAIAVMASRSRTSYTLINHLASRFDVALVIFEAVRREKLLRYRVRKLGRLTVARQLAFSVYDRLVIRPRSRTRVDALLADHDDSPPDERLHCVDVETVNSEAVRDLLREVDPGCVVVSGTGIIGKKTLAVVPTFINIHAGLTPRYRGVHGGYWAVVEGRPDLAGVTVHKVDPGVDTGEIIGQAHITVEPTDTFRTLPVKQLVAGLPLMAAAVGAALDGTLATYTRDDLESRQWFSPTFADHLRFTRQLRRL